MSKQQRKRKVGDAEEELRDKDEEDDRQEKKQKMAKQEESSEEDSDGDFKENKGKLTEDDEEEEQEEAEVGECECGDDADSACPCGAEMCPAHSTGCGGEECSKEYCDECIQSKPLVLCIPCKKMGNLSDDNYNVYCDTKCAGKSMLLCTCQDCKDTDEPAWVPIGLPSCPHAFHTVEEAQKWLDQDRNHNCFRRGKPVYHKLAIVAATRARKGGKPPLNP